VCVWVWEGRADGDGRREAKAAKDQERRAARSTERSQAAGGRGSGRLGWRGGRAVQADGTVMKGRARLHRGQRWDGGRDPVHVKASGGAHGTFASWSASNDGHEGENKEARRHVREKENNNNTTQTAATTGSTWGGRCGRSNNCSTAMQGTRSKKEARTGVRSNCVICVWERSTSRTR